MGQCNVTLQLTDDSRNPLHLTTNALLVKNLNHQVFLGMDVLSGNHVDKLTNNALHLKYDNKSVTLPFSESSHNISFLAPEDNFLFEINAMHPRAYKTTYRPNLPDKSGNLRPMSMPESLHQDIDTNTDVLTSALKVIIDPLSTSLVQVKLPEKLTHKSNHKTFTAQLNNGLSFSNLVIPPVANIITKGTTEILVHNPHSEPVFIDQHTPLSSIDLSQLHVFNESADDRLLHMAISGSEPLASMQQKTQAAAKSAAINSAAITDDFQIQPKNKNSGTHHNNHPTNLD